MKIFNSKLWQGSDSMTEQTAWIICHCLQKPEIQLTNVTPYQQIDMFWFIPVCSGIG